MKKTLNKKTSYSVLIIFSLSAIFAVIGAALAYVNQFYRVNSGATTKITEYGVCKNVKNNNSLDIFVPTNIEAEWTAFRNGAALANVVLTDCVVTPPLVCDKVGVVCINYGSMRSWAYDGQCCYGWQGCSTMSPPYQRFFDGTSGADLCSGYRDQCTGTYVDNFGACICVCN